MLAWLKRLLGIGQERALKKYRATVKQVVELEEEYQSYSDDQVKQLHAKLQERARSGEALENLLPEAYAVVKNVCRRLCGKQFHIFGYDQQWDLIPYDVQILGGIAMFYSTVAEMMTGEGKTLTASMPLYLHALTGKPVHLVTVNDYLAQRDCQWTGEIFRWLGLTTKSLTNDVPTHERKAIYQADIIYGTASEFGFDYLRDNAMAMRTSDQVQRGHFFALIDEIDSILIDEARTPLIISGPANESKQMYTELKDTVATLVKKQKKICDQIATKTQETLKPLLSKESLTKQDKESIQQSCQKLWLLGKGAPKHSIYLSLVEDPDIRQKVDEWELFYLNDQNKQERQKAIQDLLITVDEKASEYELTDSGINAWIEVAGGDSDDFLMLDLLDEYWKIDEDNLLTDQEKIAKKIELQKEDELRKERSHNLRQLLRAHLLMEKDVDYIVHQDKIVIIDENTGRPQPGRRFSDGLHQAIEAKEGLEIQKETQTYATITLQNYFRMYTKMAGMSGTAKTDADEFQEIYQLSVVEVPTYKACIRDDQNDEMYMTDREKSLAIVAKVKEIHAQGRPILIGTESVEVSEKISRLLTEQKLKYEILNAKNHEREAEIISNAGQKNAITISTNMAGRGTDIKLGEGVEEIGGLYVLGTTRHHSRRIDRQLRGRSGRLGDPGTSKFYVSFEDSLMRLFSSPSLTKMIKRFRPPEGEPISASILNRSIETAQKRVEQRNYQIRKHTLEYDNVMNLQRKEIYSFRNDLLSTTDLVHYIRDLIEDAVSYKIELIEQAKGATDTADHQRLVEWLATIAPVNLTANDLIGKKLEEVSQTLIRAVKTVFEEHIQRQKASLEDMPNDEEKEKLINKALKTMMLFKLDDLWKDHLHHMDHLRTDVGLRSVAQKDPLMEYKHEAFRLFSDLNDNMMESMIRDLFNFRFIKRPIEQVQPTQMKHQQLSPEGQEDRDEKPQTIRSEMTTVGRNDPCRCGSGLKFKKCHGRTDPKSVSTV